MKKIDIPEFKTKKELFDFMVENKSLLIAQKKFEIKKSDPFISAPLITGPVKESAKKANAEVSNPPDILKTTLIINTTNIMDSHDDVHIPGLWDKSITENRFPMHLKSHNMDFEFIISDGEDLTVYVKDYTWKELGFDWEGKTQGLTFDSNIKKSRNEFMHDQYSKGFVKNHSVGMQYVRLILAVNDEDYGAEFEAWEKYYPQIINQDIAEAKGYFWAVKEAKFIEGSAVPRGSNPATPTLDNNRKSISEPVDTTQEQEPVDTTPKRDINSIIKHLNFTK